MVTSRLSPLTSTNLFPRPFPFHPDPAPRFPHPHLPLPPILFSARSDASAAKNALISNSTNQSPPRSLFPGGYKRPEIKVPSIILRLSPEDVFKEDKAVLDVVDKAVSDRVGIVVLSGGEGSGKKLYEAACLLKSVIRDRAYLLIDERVDIAAAVNASGVLLSDQGLPTIVARNMMMDAKPDSVILPLVARNVQNHLAALDASNSEGADFLIYTATGAEELLVSVFGNVKIPIFVMIDSLNDRMLLKPSLDSLRSEVSGFVVSVDELNLLSEDDLRKLFYNENDSVTKSEDSGKTFDTSNGFPGFSRLEERHQQLIDKERSILLEAIDVIERATPLMGDIALLKDAVFQLREPFSLVIVGEFNTGKSSVINAFLGQRYLKDGVIPTTNEITFLRHVESESSEQQCERHPDGQYICYVASPMLKEMIIVDTPGTNVILQRQQRLTEEFVPRADLILFVMSADRPLTESEVAFLRYTQQWKKKVVFVLNKSDLYRNPDELEEAIMFIKENTKNTLNVEHVTVYPIAARAALEAKLSGFNDLEKQEHLRNTPYPGANSFADLEKYLYSFLDPLTDNGIERLKLKLETPLKIAEKVLIACQKLVREDCQKSEKDLVMVNNLVNSVNDYTLRMENESIARKRQILSLINDAQARAIKLTESTLQLSNLDLVAKYVTRGEKSTQTPVTSSLRSEIIDPAITEAQKLLKEYATWLESSNEQRGNMYSESLRKTWPSVVPSVQYQLQANDLLRTKYEVAATVLGDFSAAAASKLFEQEIREVFLGTFGGLGAAGLSASLLTSVLPTTLEDLLALGLCSAGGLLVISNFPGRRRQTVDKVRRTADALARELEEAMQTDLLEATKRLNDFVGLIAKPYQQTVQNRVNHLLATCDELAEIEKKLEALQIEIQNFHVSR